MFWKNGHFKKRYISELYYHKCIYFILKNKYLKTIPNITGYKSFLYKRIEIEKCIAFEKDKLDQHIRKWSPFINNVPTT